MTPGDAARTRRRPVDALHATAGAAATVARALRPAAQGDTARGPGTDDGDPSVARTALAAYDALAARGRRRVRAAEQTAVGVATSAVGVAAASVRVSDAVLRRLLRPGSGDHGAPGLPTSAPVSAAAAATIRSTGRVAARTADGVARVADDLATGAGALASAQPTSRRPAPTAPATTATTATPESTTGTRAPVRSAPVGPVPATAPRRRAPGTSTAGRAASPITRAAEDRQAPAPRTVPTPDEVPIADYDHLTLGDVTARLRHLSAGELRAVRDYEHAHANRLPVLTALEARLTAAESAGAAGAAPSPVPAESGPAAAASPGPRQLADMPGPAGGQGPVGLAYPDDPTTAVGSAAAEPVQPGAPG